MINNNEHVYLDLLHETLHEGSERGDRTGTGTVALFGREMRFDLRESFPLLTTKEIKWEAVVSELLWMLEGSGDERRLAELRWGDSRENLEHKKTIWTQNADSPYWRHKAQFKGDCGRIYGVQWRDWRTPVINADGSVSIKHTDQLVNLIKGIKEKPHDRRHIISAWNPGEFDQMALPPCHMEAQFFVENGELSCLMRQRSTDMVLGSPFNIAFYALLTFMTAQVTGLKPRELIIYNGDTHVYLNHFEAAHEQLSRSPLAGPAVRLNPAITDITKFTMSDVHLIGYNSHPAIKAPMSV